jgi:hypothetical protein
MGKKGKNCLTITFYCFRIEATHVIHKERDYIVVI